MNDSCLKSSNTPIITIGDNNPNISSISIESLLFSGINCLTEYAICILSMDGTIQFCNQAILTLCGYQPNALVGQKINILFPENQTFEQLAAKIHYKHSAKQEQWLIKADNSQFWADLSLSLIKQEATTIGYNLIFADRTNVHEQEIFHRETEERYQHAINGAQVGVWDWNIEDDSCYWNQHFLELFGIPKYSKPCLKTALNQIHPDDRHKVTDMMQAHIERYVPYEVEYRIIQPSGEMRHCLSRGHAVRDKQGKAVRIVGAVLDISQQKMAEEKIKELHGQLEKRFSATFQQAAVGFAHVGLDSLWRCVNAKLCEILGYPEHELTKLTFQETTYPEDLPADLENVRKILAGEISTYSMDKRFIRKDGSLIWANLTVSLVRDHNNNPEYFISVIEDISERKNAEFKLQETFEKLQESESRLKGIIDSNITGIFFGNTDKIIFEANNQFLNMIGYSREDLEDNKFKASFISPPEFQNSDAMVLKELIEKGFYHNYEKQYIRKDGKRIDVLLNLILVSNKKNMEFVVFALDITERKRAEQILLESEQRFRKMADEAPIMLWMTDTQGKTIYANKYWLEYVGLTLDEYVGRFRLNEPVVHPDDANKARKNFLDCVKKQKKYFQKVRYRRADGEYRWITQSGNPRFTPDGEFLGHVGVCQDITERKLAKDNLKKLTKELEKRVDQRTREIQLVNKELEAFSYSVSHDLRAPLRSIDGFSNIIANRYAHLLDDKGKEYFHYIIENTQRMGQLIDDLLQLSRISRIELELQEVNLSQLATETARYIQLQSPSRKVQFHISPGIIAKADARLIRIVLDNLLNNAWKFTSKVNEAYIEFNVIKENNQDIYLVKDNGAGFNMQFYDKLFGAFQRLHTLTEFPGTGVGLATVQRIIHRHKGQVWAQGEINAGATFFFTLPQQIE